MKVNDDAITCATHLHPWMQLDGNGRLWLLQTRAAKRSAQAAVRLALQLHDDGLSSGEIGIAFSGGAVDGAWGTIGHGAEKTGLRPRGAGDEGERDKQERQNGKRPFQRPAAP